MSDIKYKDIKEKSFEEAMKELEDIVRNLESGGQPLEKSIALYERGTEIKAHCENMLKEARLKVETITEDSDNNITTKTMDVE